MTSKAAMAVLNHPIWHAKNAEQVEGEGRSEQGKSFPRMLCQIQREGTETRTTDDWNAQG